MGRARWTLVAAIIAGLALTGCSVKMQKHHPEDMARIGELEAQVAQLSRELDATASAKEQEAQRFLKAREELEKSLKAEIAEKNVMVQELRGRLVITVQDRVLFDSGKAELRKESFPVLDKVASVLKKSVPDKNVGVEGHTDNVPITYSGWKSNWELSTARALSVLHYFTDERKLNAARFSAAGYGEYRPVSDNDTDEGKQKNRRVEIYVIEN